MIPKTFLSTFLAATAFGLVSGLDALAAQAVPLLDPVAPTAGWEFAKGAEFPGATGGLSADAAAPRDGRPSLKIAGDFSKGGNYVQAGRKIDKVEVDDLSLWVRNPDSDRFTLRINDASGQTHQIDLKTDPGAEWQQIIFPLKKFFAHRGEADAVTNVARYEAWGGAKDSAWHGPATAIYILAGRLPGKNTRTLWLSDIVIHPPAETSSATVATLLPLDEIVDGKSEWRFSRGEEFPGASGSLTVVKEAPAGADSSIRLAGDFTAGGVYVAAIRNLSGLAVKEISAIHMQVRSDNAAFIGVQLVDGSGQTHQQSRTKITPDGQWRELVLHPQQIAGGEHWGGANDGKWHGLISQLAISLSDKADEKNKKPVLYLAEIRADALAPASVQSAAFKAGFEGAAKLGADWQVTGDVSIDTKAASEGSHSLLLTRSLENIEQPCSAAGPAFAAAPGQWEIGVACKGDLHSADSSYNGVVEIEWLYGAGKAIGRSTVADLFGARAWERFHKQVEAPKGAQAARFTVRLNKTWGRFWCDDLSAAYLAPASPKDDRISRLLFSTAQLGNLLLPSDPRRVDLTVETRRLLKDCQRTVSYVVRDYWGAEQTQPATMALGAPQKKGDGYQYPASIDLANAALEVGRYYELHASIPQEGAEPFANYTSFAILPEAETKRHKPEEIPFTGRNWDNRLPEFVRLTDRLGVRICGIWGGWQSKPPYKAEAPTLDLCEKLGMGWLTGTPASTIEQGKKEYDETALHSGVHNLIEQFGKVRPMFIDLGNEPHGTGDRVLANVAAYRAVYEEVKKVDPTIPVIATAVEPNEEYFGAGYGKWCDVFDFHIYESAEDVRRTIGEYQALMKKYECVKPLWSTELGLNSQGLTRQTVAAELIKKFSVFFAAGGSNVSWFGLLYPDPDAKDHGGSGDSHNVFDCRYNRYAPRLDAIAYYNAVNAISIKKFVAEKKYPEGISSFLFRDRENHCLQVLWKEKGRQDVAIPLSGVHGVQVIRIDGSRRALNAAGTDVTLSVTEDPLLLLYDGGPGLLPDSLLAPAASIINAPVRILAKGGMTLSVKQNSEQKTAVTFVPPPFWTAVGESGASSRTFAPPHVSSAREADFTVKLMDSKEDCRGEIYLRIPIDR